MRKISSRHIKYFMIVSISCLALFACAVRHPLDLSDPAVRQSFETKRDRPDPALLAKITLPMYPSKREVREYIDAIVYVSKNQNSYLDYDPQVAMLMEVGHGNIDELIRVTRDYDRYVVEAIKALATAADKERIFEALEQHPALIDVVSAKGWVKEARETLIRKMRGNPENVPPGWIAAVASLEDPTTYDDLLNYLINGTNKHWTYRNISRLPGIDLSQAAPIAWEKTMNDKYERSYLTEGALSAGYLPALDFVVESLDNNTLASYRFSPRALFFQFTGVQGSNEELKKWHQENRGSLGFDAQTKRFVVKK